MSVAQVEESGPFSDFSGYRRTMVLLKGDGMRLRFDGGRATQLRDVGDMAEFDGGLARQCDLLGGPCADLNLIVSHSFKESTAWIERVRDPCILPRRHAGTRLIFAISGNLSVDFGAGQSTLLDPWDLAVISPDEGGRAAPESPDPPLVFFASLDDDFR